LPGRDLALLVEAARDAGRIARRHFRKAPETWDKPDGQGPVTAADLEVDRMLRATLGAARPDYGWLSEETPDSAARLRAPRLFIVDPIDGTRAFIAGEESFAHALAVAEAGVVVAAAIYLPIRDLLYTAEAGQGACLNGRRLEVSARALLEGASVLAARSTLDPGHWPGGVPPVARHFRASIAWRLALVAEGRFDAFVTLRPAWEWDIAAGDLLIREAGGRITDPAGAALRFNNAQPQVPGVLAGGGAIHAGLLARRTG
jgi:myo-inositol-1(or 4)-monophosphatase